MTHDAKRTEVELGRFKMTEGSDCLTATGIGSCLVVTLYDRRTRKGAMAHATLPLARAGSAPDASYVDSAIDIMLRRLEEAGVRRDDIECKIVGGSNMFPHLEAHVEDIGKQNVESARRRLKALKIPLVGESVGGSQGRSVEFCPMTGIVTVKIKF